MAKLVVYAGEEIASLSQDPFMRPAPSRRMLAGLLCIVLLMIIAAFAIPGSLSGPAATVFGVCAATASLALLWLLLIADPAEARPRLQNMRFAGALFISPFVLFALVPGVGPPEFATPQANLVRYVVLAVAPILLAVGFGVLALSLALVQERRWSPPAALLGIIGGVLDTVFACIKIAEYKLLLRDPSAAIGPFVEDIAVLLLFFASLCFYAATAAAALSMSAAGRLPRYLGKTLAATSIAGAAALALRGLDFPSAAEALANPAMTPGWIAGIPAVPWLFSGALGVLALSLQAHGDPLIKRAPFSRHA